MTQETVTFTGAATIKVNDQDVELDAVEISMPLDEALDHLRDLEDFDPKAFAEALFEHYRYGAAGEMPRFMAEWVFQVIGRAA